MDSFGIGDVVVNEMRQCAKIVSFRNGRYGLSGWTTQEHAEKATVAQIFLNTHGVESANLQLVVKGKTTKPRTRTPRTAK